MAQVPYPHIEAPGVIRIDGVRAYNPGDPVPLDVAKRLGLLDTEDAPPVLAGVGVASSPQFSDAELKVAAEAAAAGANLSPDATGAGEPPSSSEEAPTVTPPQAPTVVPPQGRTKNTPTPQS